MLLNIFNVGFSVRDRESALFFSKLSFVLYTGCLLTKESLSILTSSCHVSLHSHKLLWIYWLDGLYGPLNQPNGQLIGFTCPLRGGKKLLLEQKKIRFSFKVNFHLKRCIILNLKMWILKMRAPQAFFFYFLKSSISKWENGWKMNCPPVRNIPPPSSPSHRATPTNQM